MRVLLVDDSPATRAFARAALEVALGAELDLVEAGGGFEALRLLPRGPYDIVITDINMPDINGLELLNFIRKSSQHQKTLVLLISTQKSEKDMQRGMQLGADAFLPKPFSAEQLAASVEQLLSSAAVQG